MLAHLKKHWFFVGIAAVIVLAYAAPAVGVFVRAHSVLDVGVFAAFAITGLTLDTSSVVRQLHEFRVLAASLLSSLVFIPVLGFVLARFVFPDQPDLVVGVCIIGVAPVSVASGIVMTGLARGNVPLSLFITVTSNVAAVFAIPFSLNFLLQAHYDIQLSAAETIARLAVTVLVPTMAGQVARIWLKDAIQPFRKTFSIFQQLITLLIIFNAVSGSADRLTQAGIVVLYVFMFTIVWRCLVLGANLLVSRAVGLDRPSTAAFTIHTSQKTLTVSYVVWASSFATLYPMALLPSIAYHISQMFMDTVVAQTFLHRAERLEVQPAE